MTTAADGNGVRTANARRERTRSLDRAHWALVQATKGGGSEWMFPAAEHAAFVFYPGRQLVDDLCSRAARRVDHPDSPARIALAPPGPALPAHVFRAGRTNDLLPPPGIARVSPHPLRPVEVVLQLSRHALEPAGPAGVDPLEASLVVAVEQARCDAIEGGRRKALRALRRTAPDRPRARRVLPPDGRAHAAATLHSPVAARRCRHPAERRFRRSRVPPSRASACARQQALPSFRPRSSRTEGTASVHSPVVTRRLMARAGLEPATPRFSAVCSTN